MTEPMSPEELRDSYARGQKLNVMETLKTGPLPNVTFDAALDRGDFYMVRRQWTDGTHALAYMKMGEMLQELLEQIPFSVKNPPAEGKSLAGIRYTIGPLALLEGHDSKRDDWRNWREVFLLPVKCEYDYE